MTKFTSTSDRPSWAKPQATQLGNQRRSALSYERLFSSCPLAQDSRTPSYKKKAWMAPLTANRVKCMELLQSLELSVAQDSWVFEGLGGSALHFFKIRNRPDLFPDFPSLELVRVSINW